MNLIRDLISKWHDDGIAVRSGVSPEAIAEFEHRNDVVLPDDFMTYFLMIDGMGERHTCDSDFFGFWRFQDLITIADDLPDRSDIFDQSHDYFMFADHSISLPTFAIRLSNEKSTPTPVAGVYSDFGALDVEDFFESFTDFVSVYLRNPTELVGAIPYRTIERLNTSNSKPGNTG